MCDVRASERLLPITADEIWHSNHLKTTAGVVMLLAGSTGARPVPPDELRFRF